MFNLFKTLTNRLTLLLLLFTCLVSVSLAQVKITDTIYFNNVWRICEKPVATYYRVGILAALDGVWYYTGQIKDYTIDHDLLMEGEYSEAGLRDGNFKYFYPDGKLMVSGKYKKNMASEYWNWYYPDGKEKATIYFPDEPQKFQFVKFTDKDGLTTLENGNGKFTWNTNDFESKTSGYIVNGFFKSGKRSGTWNYNHYNSPMDDASGYIEKYNEKGKLTRRLSNTYSGMYNDKIETVFFFTPQRLFTIDAISYDDLFKINGDSSALNNLIYYLVEHKATEVNLRYKVFDTAFATILKAIERYSNRIYYDQIMDIDCKIEFKIGTKGYLEDISFTGTGIDSNVKRFYTFLLGKFKYIEMPGDKSVGIETNYIIYCFLVDFHEILPNNLNTNFTKKLFFSFFPKEKIVKYLHDNKKTLKDMNIDLMNNNYYRRH